MPLEFEEPKTEVETSATARPSAHPIHGGQDLQVGNTVTLESNCRALSFAARQRRASYLRWQAGLSVLACLSLQS